MKIWTGKLTLNAERRKAGDEVEAKVVISDSGQTIFEVRGFEGKESGAWRACDPDEIHAPSWLRALAETGKEVA